MDSARVYSMLESAAQFRLQAKSRRIHRMIAAVGREQGVYQALAQTLGYLHNQRPFAILCQRLPLTRVLKDSPAQREALFFGVSGFLEMARPDDSQKETRAYLRALWSQVVEIEAGLHSLDGAAANAALEADRDPSRKPSTAETRCAAGHALELGSCLHATH
jgi:hypothetical protein